MLLLRVSNELAQQILGFVEFVAESTTKGQVGVEREAKRVHASLPGHGRASSRKVEWSTLA